MPQLVHTCAHAVRTSRRTQMTARTRFEATGAMNNPWRVICGEAMWLIERLVVTGCEPQRSTTVPSRRFQGNSRYRF